MAISIKPFESKDDERLGQLESSGAIKQWPEVDILGREYTTPSTTVTLAGGQHFVVLPPGSNSVELINLVKAEYGKLQPSPKSSAQSLPTLKPAEGGSGDK